MPITVPDLLRELATERELREKAEQRVLELETKLESVTSQIFTQEPKQWFTPKEAAVFIGMSVHFLNQDRIKKQPTIPFDKRGRRTVRYHRKDLENYLDTRKKR